MSVYARKNRQGETVYRYDFILEGRRFLSPTSYPTRRTAEAAERRRRIDIAEGRDDAGQTLTIDQAAGLWWHDVARHHRSAAIIEKRIETCLRLIGPNVRIRDIRTATVNDAIQKRRKEFVVNAAALRGGRASGKLVSPTTVNRDIIDTLRPILNHAAEIYDLTLPRIAWKKLRLKEAGEVVREFTAAEIEAWAAGLSWIETVFLGIALTYGPRFGEMFFPPDAIRLDAPGGPELELGRWKGRGGQMHTTRKDGSLHTVYLTEEHASLLGYLASRARAGGLDVIWFEEPEGPKEAALADPRAKPRPPKLREITYWGMRQRLLSAAKKAGIAPGRIIHGMRHHAGTQLLRRTKNLVLAQEALGHRQITTTRRYAHASKDDLRAGLAEVSRQSPAALLPNLPKDED